jgi:hypothetical protein
MATFANIRAAAAGTVSTFHGAETPAGHFEVTAKIVGIPTLYLVKGEKDAPDAVIIGRVELTKPVRGYKGSSLKGGTYLASAPRIEDYFKKMV